MLPSMTGLDLNLLTALDVLLAERSVTAAAKKMGLSVSAMSRTLARLRLATGDPLLVQAGRSLVTTPYAERLADRVHAAAQEARAILGLTSDEIDPASLDRTFMIRANEGFIALFAPAIVTTVIEAAPHVRLRFAPKSDKAATPLRDGTIDLEIGTAGSSAPEMRSQLLSATASSVRHARITRYLPSRSRRSVTPPADTLPRRAEALGRDRLMTLCKTSACGAGSWWWLRASWTRSPSRGGQI